jgi:hypothetical protein
MSQKEEQLIIKLRADTAKLNRDLNKAKNRLKRFQGSISKVGKSIRNTMLAAFGGAVILDGIKSAVKSLANFELVMDKVHAISGASAEQLKALTNNALLLGRTTKFTAGEVGNLQLQLSKLGFSTSKILAATSAVTKLALVTDEDLGEAAKTLAGTLNSFNLEASQSERIANLMAESFSKSALTLEKFTVGTANSGATAKAWGVTAEVNTARLAKLVDANIDASKAGTDLRKIYMSLNAAGMTYSDALEMVAGSSNKLSTAQKLVGIRAAGALLILTQQEKKVNALTGQFEDSNREIDKQSDIIEDNLVTSWALFTSALDGLIQKATPVRNVLKGMTDAATKLMNSMIPVEIRASDAAFERWTKTLNQFGDSEESLNDLGVAFDLLKDDIKEAKAQIWLFDKLNRNIDGKILPNAQKSVEDLEEDYANLIITLGSLEGTQKAYQNRITAIIDALKDLKKAEEDARDAAIIRQQSIPLQDSKTKGFGFSEVAGDPINPFSDEKLDIVKEGMKKWQDAYQQHLDAMARKKKEYNDMLSDIIKQTTIDAMIHSFDTAASALMGGGAGWNDLFTGLLKILGTGMQRIGVAMILASKLLQTFQTSFASGQWYGAAAAGVALVAAGAAVNAAANNMSANLSGGDSGGGGRGGTGSFNGARGGQSINVNVQGELVADGRSLVAVFNQQNRADARQIG